MSVPEAERLELYEETDYISGTVMCLEQGAQTVLCTLPVGLREG